MKRSDITSFASLLGDGFATKIDLLTKLIQDRHYPSVGAYKERLLSQIIKEYVPQKYSIGTGFVLFAHKEDGARAHMDEFDSMNMGAHSLSRQCDILIYDAHSYPVIFRDGDFVIVRPESVCAVIEVKGTANPREILHTLQSFLEFGRRWRETQLFYMEHHQTLSRNPSLQLLCWNVGVTRKGKAQTNGTKVRTQLADFYARELSVDELVATPRLSKLYMYNECTITEAISLDEHGHAPSLGYVCESGKFSRIKEDGSTYIGGDKTIADLLASLHYLTSDNFNRFYSYAEEIIGVKNTYSHKGYTQWLNGSEFVKAANADYVDGTFHHLRGKGQQ
ncbi:DUF6602 domain-containing protein [Methylobacterium nonmethylotrophicum]|uniref:DUF6602 domain-containing protein n=1 Tax=Methylobacterium nonmethylotrophicum TaxID=1141884 RepID=A0A4Z0NGY4_9HYPH|nr:DUF6602 domain-containing protein [Methylobacterium nonmethylotrophicum]TGD94912.1 hypothetical protein EU555_30535 [Methylobacterium nonmethylotrophicum]